MLLKGLHPKQVRVTNDGKRHICDLFFTLSFGFAPFVVLYVVYSLAIGLPWGITGALAGFVALCFLLGVLTIPREKSPRVSVGASETAGEPEIT